MAPSPREQTRQSLRLRAGCQAGRSGLGMSEPGWGKGSSECDRRPSRPASLPPGGAEGRRLPSLRASSGASRAPLRKRLREGGTTLSGVRLRPGPASPRSGLRPPATDWETEACAKSRRPPSGLVREGARRPPRDRFWETRRAERVSGCGSGEEGRQRRVDALAPGAAASRSYAGREGLGPGILRPGGGDVARCAPGHLCPHNLQWLVLVQGRWD